MLTYPIAKGSGSTLDYSLDLSRWMIAGDAISTVIVTVDRDDLTVTAPAHSNVLATVWVSGGSEALYTLTWTVETTSGRILSRHTALSVEA